jgi:hypothetical protein
VGGLLHLRALEFPCHPVGKAHRHGTEGRPGGPRVARTLSRSGARIFHPSEYRKGFRVTKPFRDSASPHVRHRACSLARAAQWARIASAGVWASSTRPCVSERRSALLEVPARTRWAKAAENRLAEFRLCSRTHPSLDVPVRRSGRAPYFHEAHVRIGLNCEMRPTDSW